MKGKRRNYRPFEAKKPRLRNKCPDCGSVSVRKLSRSRLYVCVCGWKGENVIKEEY